MQLRDITLVKLAREIAIDHLDSEAIQELYKLTPDEWLVIQRSKRFQQLLEQELIDWQSAKNTPERTRLKGGAILEHWLPEANTRLHDPNESLGQKTELAKLIANISGITKPETVGAAGSGFSVTINLGSTQAPVTFQKELTAPLSGSLPEPVTVIEHQK